MFAGRSGSVRTLQLAGSTVLITGASGGLGHAIARALHARGARILLNGRRAEALEELAAGLGERAEVLPLDLAEPGAALVLAEWAGDVDAVVANAALPASGSVEDFTHEEIDRAIDVNLRAPIQLTRALLPGMIERGRGHLLYVSSLSGKVASIRSCIYSATKFGIRGFASGVREDLHGTGVGVTVVFPSFIADVGMYAETRVKLPRGVSLISAEQVAAAVVRGIEEGRDEIDVAPLSLRAGVVASSLAPKTTARLQRRLGSDRIASEMADAQRDKR
jgi:uncharacterized protein